jgi:3-oxoacyl-[acyl-carrier protein] reductase
LLENKVAIITGASRGIGKAIAKEFAAQGAFLILNGTNRKLLEELKNNLSAVNKKHEVVIGDISNPETSKNLVNKAVNLFKRIDIIVNNAGIITRETTEKMSLLDWKKVIDINLTGTLMLCKEAMPILKRQKSGRIINISSRAAKYPKTNAAPSYGASKAGIIYLTKHFALELGSFGVNVNTVCPGPIESDMTKQWTDSYSKMAIEKIPLKRFGKPEEVAKTVLFLASNMSDFITGETININGGYSMD